MGRFRNIPSFETGRVLPLIDWTYLPHSDLPLPYLTVDQNIGSVFIFQIIRRRKVIPTTSSSKTFCRISCFGFASGLGCRLVVASPQATADETGIF
jgi:hypothetical protein